MTPLQGLVLRKIVWLEIKRMADVSFMECVK